MLTAMTGGSTAAQGQPLPTGDRQTEDTDTQVVHDTSGQTDLTNRTFHLKAAKHTFFSSACGTF